MADSGRIITATELCDIDKENTLTIQGSWTSSVDPLVTTTNQLEDLMYYKEVGLEDRLAAPHFEKKFRPDAFPSPPKSTYDDKI